MLFLVAGLPVLSILTARNQDIFLLPRRSLYLSAAFSQWLLALLTAGVALGTSTGLTFFKPPPLAVVAAWTIGLTLAALAGLALVLALQARGWWPEESRLVHLLIPGTRQEKLWALLVLAPTAGFCEEFVYRGYLISCLSSTLHSMGWAWVISSIAFGMAHTYQKPNGAVRAGLLGALLAWPVARLGSLYPSMAAHFLIDAIGLVWLGPGMMKQAVDR